MKFGLRKARGISVPHHKATSGCATVAMPPPAKVMLLMQQHIGAPCQPAVAKGDKVFVGTLVGKAGGFVGADIHSGVSGTVVEVGSRLGANGQNVGAVTIECDGEQTLDPGLAPPVVTDKASFLAAVRAAGLVGLGGAGFPTAVKLDPKNPDAIDTLIVNAAECEPYITADEREMMECSGDVLSALEAAMKWLGIPKAIIAIERNKPEAMDLMFSLTQNTKAISVLPLKTRYPQGAEKVLIQTATGREVPLGGLPADVGVLVMNVTTLGALGRYLATGMPLVKKRLTVAGGAVAKPQNVEVVIGTHIADVLAFCGEGAEAPAKILMGGPMMGVSMACTDYPIIKQNNAILAFTRAEAELPEPQPCIRCGRCVAACPVFLSPVELNDAYEKRDFERLLKMGADGCIACGSCSYVCPAKRLVSQNNVLARDFTNRTLREQAQKAKLEEEKKAAEAKSGKEASA